MIEKNERKALPKRDMCPDNPDNPDNPPDNLPENPDYVNRDSVVDGLLGLAIGDAFGVPVEFMSRREVRALDLRDMVGRDTNPGFQGRWTDMIPSGAWSDDTSMTIAAMSSIIEKKGEIDWEDIMRKFDDWWFRSQYTSLDFPFGLGSNISASMTRYLNGVPALECGGKAFVTTATVLSCVCSPSPCTVSCMISVIRRHCH